MLENNSTTQQRRAQGRPRLHPIAHELPADEMPAVNQQIAHELPVDDIQAAHHPIAHELPADDMPAVNQLIAHELGFPLNAMGRNPQIFMGLRQRSMGVPWNPQSAIDRHHWNSQSSIDRHHWNSQSSIDPHPQIPANRNEFDPLIIGIFSFFLFIFILILNLTIVKIKTFIF